MRWGEKRYHSLDYELKQMFKEKVYKIALNGGMTCPNRGQVILPALPDFPSPNR